MVEEDEAGIWEEEGCVGGGMMVRLDRGNLAHSSLMRRLSHGTQGQSRETTANSNLGGQFLPP